MERWFGEDGGCGGIGCGGTGDIGRETFLCLAALLAGCVGLVVGFVGSGDWQDLQGNLLLNLPWRQYRRGGHASGLGAVAGMARGDRGSVGRHPRGLFRSA